MAIRTSVATMEIPIEVEQGRSCTNKRIRWFCRYIGSLNLTVKYYQFPLRIYIYLPSQRADHLKSIPIFKDRLESSIVLRADPSSLAF
jgi:hypothetical protein